MPLPLPHLDTRRWTDLVEEARALIPRYAPEWTDHNVHDPGITVLDLLAWLIEQDIYRVNRVPDRHRRAFLELVGFLPRPPEPARAALTFDLSEGASSLTLPAGTLAVASRSAAAAYSFRTTAPLRVVPADIVTVQTFDGAEFVDQTRLWNDGLPFPLLGPNPQAASHLGLEQQPAFYIGLDEALPPGEEVSLWLRLDGPHASAEERALLLDEAARQAARCRPIRPKRSCPPGETEDPFSTDAWCSPDTGEEPEPESEAADVDTKMPLPPHHAVQTVWEYHDGAAWQPVAADPGAVVDETRSLTLDGAVLLTLPAAMAELAVGAVPENRFYLRCRLSAGLPDAAPVLRDLSINTVAAEQRTAAQSTLPIAPGVTPVSAPTPGQSQRLRMSIDPEGVITDLSVDPGADVPEIVVLAYEAATATAPGVLTAALVPTGLGIGLPFQQMTLPNAPIAGGAVQLWTDAPEGVLRWRSRADFDASTPVDTDFTLDATSGTMTFGDGVQGRVVPAGALILAAYDETAGAAGNVAAGVPWELAEDVSAVETVTNRAAATGGADAESLSHAAGRAAEALWAHERLVELCTLHSCSTLDQLDRDAVLRRAAPERAATLLDFERLALSVPGTQIRRARAWSGIDAAYPCLKAPGTVTVVIVPSLPQGRPQPGRGLVAAVRRYLDRRRVIGTRLVVVGPEYVEVRVDARVRVKSGGRPERVYDDIIVLLDAFLDPLQGGTLGRGWPFGRDVYRSEILHVIDEVAGVDHVLDLELSAGTDEGQCGNLCIGPTQLTTPGTHTITVE